MHYDFETSCCRIIQILKDEDWEVAHLAMCFSYKHEGPNSIPRIHIRTWAQWSLFVMPGKGETAVSLGFDG